MSATSSKFVQHNYRFIKTLGIDLKTHRRIYLAERGTKQYVLKPLQEQMFTQAKRTTELQDCRFYMTNTLLHLVGHFSLSLRQRKRILYDVLEGLIEMHGRRWVHTGLKPNNVLVNYKATDSECVIEKVMMGDIDNAVFLEAGHAIACQVGNVWWRSPEGQLGVSVEASTDIFSFGLVVRSIVYFRTDLGQDIGADFLSAVYFRYAREAHLYIDEKMRHPKVPLYFQVLDRTIEYFGHLPTKLERDVSPEVREILTIVENTYGNGSDEFHFFKDWAENRLPDLGMEVNLEHLNEGFQAFVGRAMKMDPDARASPESLLDDP